MIDDLDKLLATRKDFLLGRWVADARKCGITKEEKVLYEMNAKDLMTLWGDKDCPLHEYACRQWSGLLSDFYKPRWKQFFDKIDIALSNGKEVDVAAFQKEIARWEWKWVNKRKDYTVNATGHAVETAKQLCQKYRAVVERAHQGL